MNVLAVAFTEIAAALLDCGRTVHFTFGLPFGVLTLKSTSTIKFQSKNSQKSLQRGWRIIISIGDIE
jgi:predicted Co/Zn/Cd cation transporter (cation efflux family)